jgi:hypothetical protein
LRFYQTDTTGNRTEQQIADNFGVSDKTIKRRFDEILDSLPESGKLSKEAVLDSDFAFLGQRYDWQPDILRYSYRRCRSAAVLLVNITGIQITKAAVFVGRHDVPCRSVLSEPGARKPGG